MLLISTSWLVGWSYFIISSQIISYHQSHIWSSIINLILSRKKRNNTRCDWFSLTIHHYLGDSPFPPSPLLPQNLQTSLIHLHFGRHCCYYWNPGCYHVLWYSSIINMTISFSCFLILWFRYGTSEKSNDATFDQPVAEVRWSNHKINKSINHPSIFVIIQPYLIWSQSIINHNLIIKSTNQPINHP